MIYNSKSDGMVSPIKSRAEARYISAALELQKVIPKETHPHLGQITFPDFKVINGTESRARALGDALENLIQLRSEVRNKQEAKKRLGDIVLTWFRASYPFANLLIMIAKEGSAVSELRNVG